MNVDDEGIDESSELAKRFTVAKYLGYCPTLRTGYDSGPDAIRVVIALHRFLRGVSTKLPNSSSSTEVHVLREGGVLAHISRLVRSTLDTTIDAHKGTWHSMPTTSATTGEIGTRENVPRLEPAGHTNVTRAAHNTNGVVGVESFVDAKEAKRGFCWSTRIHLPIEVMEHTMEYMDHATLSTIGAGALAGADSGTG